MKKLIYLLVFVLAFSASCKKSFLDINQNPNSATTESVEPQYIAPRAIHAVGARMATSYGFTARWMGYWSRSGTYGPSAEEESYNITTNFGAGQWAGWYDILNDFHIMEQKANANGQKFYEGIAKVMKTVGFMYLVDMFNNVPYSKAFDLANNITPTYDKGQDIYNDLLKQLDNALVLITAANAGGSPNLANADIMFKGNATAWRRLINTQRLKLVVRQSQVSGFNANAELAKITTDGVIGSGQTAEINPGYVQDQLAGASKQNPYWDAFQANYLGALSDDFNRANNYVLGLFRSNNDVRYQYFFDQNIATCPSCTPPIPSIDWYGTNYGFVDPNPNNPKAANLSGVNGPGLAESPTAPQWFFTSVESMFLQAEAIARGWTIPGVSVNAQTAYENAVRESFIWLGVTNATATANAYLAQSNAIVNWAAATNKVNLIVQQKYLALVGINNFEAWVDYRRVGVPTVPKSLAPSVGPNIPLRLRYPAREYNFNPANVGAENNPDPFTSGIFWDR